LSVTIDPRRHDAVLFDLGDLATDESLVKQLHDAGVATDDHYRPLLEAANRLAVRPGRCAVVTATGDGVAAARAGGFALVIGIATT
jgi:trehalose 6-phosphate phosphatase